MKTTQLKYFLDFKKPGGTSRGVLHQKETHFIFLHKNGKTGIGECGMFRGLSADDNPEFEQNLMRVLDEKKFDLDALRDHPSITTGVEMALLDINNNGEKKLFQNPFTLGRQAIPINGLIWMGAKADMKKQIIQKIEMGFDCIKMKIGAIDFDQECELLGYIRKEFGNDIILRVDANGAFAPSEALEKLKRLSDFDLHSIEQPIKAGQWEDMAQLCEVTPLDIALDEELIGVNDPELKKVMLRTIQPQYIILKPSLLGGFTFSEEWISLAQSMGISWWVTSALESNIGLNAIAQWTAQLPYSGHQGLGTGSLFTNNIDSPLTVQDGLLHHLPDGSWDLNPLKLD